MSNILGDIVDDIQLKPSKMKLLLKWVIGVASTAVIASFTLGQIKANRLNRLNNLENSLNANTAAIIELKTEMRAGFDEVNARINKVYDDNYKALVDFQTFNNKQLTLIIDYSKTNKDLLKNILELNLIQQMKQLEIENERAKQSIIVKPVYNDSVKIMVIPGRRDSVKYKIGVR
jgi:hypothetical protein